MMDQAKRDFIVSVRQNRIDRWCTDPLYAGFVEFLDRTEPSSDHYYRYCRTFAGMLSQGLDFAGKVIRETGHPCPITRFLATCGHDAGQSGGDLRYELTEATASVDMILSFEVMEHIKDQRETSFDDIVLFRESGVRRFAAEITRALKPGGRLVMTTPNGTSALAFERLGRHEAPVLFRPHVREYIRGEIMEIFGGLQIEHYDTHDSLYGFMRPPGRLEELFTPHGWSAEHRGDLHFCVFRKPCA